MSQTALLAPGAIASPPRNRPPSVKSGKHGISKSLKHAFSRRKKSSESTGSLRRTESDLDFDLPSQGSGSIGPESLLGSEHGDHPRLSEEAVVNSSPEPRYVHCKSLHIFPTQPSPPPLFYIHLPPPRFRVPSIPHSLTPSDPPSTFDIFFGAIRLPCTDTYPADSALSEAVLCPAGCPPDLRLHRHRVDALVRSPAPTSHHWSCHRLSHTQEKPSPLLPRPPTSAEARGLPYPFRPRQIQSRPCQLLPQLPSTLPLRHPLQTSSLEML